MPYRYVRHAHRPPIRAPLPVETRAPTRSIGNWQPKRFDDLPAFRPMTAKLAKRWRTYGSEKRERAEQRHRAAWERWWEGFVQRENEIEADQRIGRKRDLAARRRIREALGNHRLGKPADLFAGVIHVYEVADVAMASNLEDRVEDPAAVCAELEALAAEADKLIALANRLEVTHAKSLLDQEVLYRMECHGLWEPEFTEKIRGYGMLLRHAAQRAEAAVKPKKNSKGGRPRNTPALRFPVAMTIDLFKRFTDLKAGRTNRVLHDFVRAVLHDYLPDPQGPVERLIRDVLDRPFLSA